MRSFIQTAIVTIMVNLLTTAVVHAKTKDVATQKKKVKQTESTQTAATPAMKPALYTAKAGRMPSSELKMKTSKVPAFEIYQKRKVNGKVETFRVKTIPKLDIGAEPLFSANNNFNVTLPDNKTLKDIAIIKKPTLREISIEQYVSSFKSAASAKTIATNEANKKINELLSLTPVDNPILSDEVKPVLVKMEDMNPTQLKLLQALIFLEIKKSYNMALALFAELISEKEVQTEATYQLALASKGLGLYSEYKHQMMKVLANEDKDWKQKAALSLARNAEQGDKALVAILDPKVEELKVELSDADQYQMNRAKYYLDKNNLTAANMAVEEISTTSPLALDAQFLKSVLMYRSGQLQEAIAAQTLVLKTLIEKDPKSELRSVSALTLARMHFQASQYKQAFDTYLKIDKSHSDWPQAMIEQAWSQILAEDYEGAAGNMFSLHTDFFKNTFAPESYVIRTVSYLNLCQFGDGSKVIHDMKRKYASTYKQMNEYSARQKDDINYYETVKTFAKNPDQKAVDGLPRNFIYELIRHPSFISEQKLINSVEEQVGRYNRITLDLIKKEREVLKEQNQASAKTSEIRKKILATSDAEKKGELKKELAQLEKNLLSYKIQYHIAKKARNSIKELRTQGLSRIENEKETFKMNAALAVKNRFQAMFTNLKNSLDQSEVLNYELYAGAGEHIRYQTAGGDISDKERAELKPEDQKSLKWEFRGEVWEDELGHYRSSLKNVCPKETISQTDAGK